MARLKSTAIIACLAWALALGFSPPAAAADNAAIGGIGGIDNGTLLYGDGTGEARLSLFSRQLALVKQARDLAGTVLPPGAPVSGGQELYFVLYVDNTTDFPAADVRITDLLNESQFTYVAGTIEQTAVPTGAPDAVIWAGPWTPLTDPVGLPDDYASVTDTGGSPGADRLTVGADPVQTNLVVSVPPGSMMAIRFRVRVN